MKKSMKRYFRCSKNMHEWEIQGSLRSNHFVTSRNCIIFECQICGIVDVATSNASLDYKDMLELLSYSLYFNYKVTLWP